MSSEFELRHIEREHLTSILLIENMQDLKEYAVMYMSKMEEDDVKKVEARVREVKEMRITP
jgi:hypothetical protein